MRPCKHAAPDVPVCPACLANRAKVAAWTAANPDRHARRTKRWARRHKRARRAICLAYYHRHAKTRYADWKRLKDYKDRGACEVDLELTCVRVWNLDEGVCHLCHEEVRHPWDTDGDKRLRATIDHLVPLSDPDSPGHVEDNVRLAHWICNVRRGSKPLPLPEIRVPF